jgi:hypothetical protein
LGDLSFDMAMWNHKLSGVTTYRLPHHPRYASVFNGKLHRTIWHRAQGTELYTRVISVHAKRGGQSRVSGKGGTFIVARGIVRDLAGAGVESAAATAKSSANLGVSKVLTASGAIETVSGHPLHSVYLWKRAQTQSVQRKQALYSTLASATHTCCRRRRRVAD